MSIFTNDSLSTLLCSKMFTFTKGNDGSVYVQDNKCFIISKEEAKQLVDGLNKFIEKADEVEINNFNKKLEVRYNM